MKFKSLLVLTLFLLFSTLTAVAQQNSDITTFVLVRHAEKIDDSTDPDLTPQGYQRAERLAEMLQNIPFDAVYSSERIRTRETVRKIADQNGVEILSYEPHEPAEEVERLLHSNLGKTVLVSGHSNTTPFFANELLDREHFEDKFDESDYGNLLIITIDGDGESKLLHLRY
ncbi:phosphoglycerate mutase family protein [Rhodohalobacter sp.]|uniref:phosphoglycerate mutase family protein n=1 Tax=Rhodohalobacter sp. TaxID=1974210 RepID=UPI002ACD9CBD|nr:phosphoglycerate mutase family protein [Rhodohalobacter sp.]MDZ7755283.1 phosphoglycerate mutase family protein [Rhodohalobacter sp.]